MDLALTSLCSVCSDKTAVSKELSLSMKKNRREADLKENKKQSMREIEDRAIEIGMKVHNEVMHESRLLIAMHTS